ncbi:low quality protein: fanconi anemia group jprotein [Lichtheimia corymbifera JMRC:FSU:9682]|uniref:DNA 5'-3' helicase n=1 Tax=Lichtheimia corymbifera JMRC:FSU:9682 TaxID=1263082 RepID=A0A068RVS5_9FUNG|nr:low quality protein: fanconi anemia group jprotein [Lichtheimia corymbifera JMRC:FSU:9682]
MTQRNSKKSNRKPQNRNRRRAGSSGFEHEEDSDMISNIDLIEPLQSTLSFLPARPAKVTKRSHDMPMKTFPMGGVPVEFPFQPYPAQLQMMVKIIQALKKKQNALLESPTGSGKSLAILCAALAWREFEKEKLRIEDEKQQLEDAKLIQDTLATMQSAPPQQSQPPPASSSAQEAIVISDEEDMDTQTEHRESSFGGTKRQQPSSLSSSPSPSDDHDQDDDFRPVKIPRVIQQQLDQQQAKKELDESEPIQLEDGEDLHEFLKRVEEHNKSRPKRRVPKIFVGSRTHKQLAQLVGELKGNTRYRPKMSILGSLHKTVAKSYDKNEECRLLLDANACRFANNVNKVVSHHKVRPGGDMEIWDIEDLIELGRANSGCPYFASRTMADSADLIFCPYNYILEPSIRKAMNIDLEGSIVILDEAHNIEDAARSAASFEATDTDLRILMKEFKWVLRDRKVKSNAELCAAYEALSVMAGTLEDFIQRPEEYNLKRDNYEEHIYVWSGQKMMQALEKGKVGETHHNMVLKEAFTLVYDHVEEVFKNESERAKEPSEEDNQQKDEKEEEEVKSQKCLTLKSLRVLEGLFLVLGYIYKEGRDFRNDYTMAIIERISRNAPITPRTDAPWTAKLAFWCQNPGVSFHEIAEQVHSVVLTSGTLSPLNTFASELQTEFPIRLEANHVIDKSQVWITSVPTGPGQVNLYGTWNQVSQFSYQDSVGQAICEIAETIPYGVLCFVPSYQTMDKLIDRWRNTGIYERMERRKHIICEPPGRGNKKAFEVLLSQYYSCISQVERLRELPEEGKNGALMFAVYRGKVSEGIDFTDNNCRAVVTLGIPFPNFKDLQIELKRDYNNARYKKGDQVLDGTEWYNTQAYRAINQALGRCIRHRKDWGAVILLEQRFTYTRNVSQLSKWVRPLCQTYGNYTNALAGLRDFAMQHMENDRLEKLVKEEKEDAAILIEYEQQQGLTDTSATTTMTTTTSTTSDKVE